MPVRSDNRPTARVRIVFLYLEVSDFTERPKLAVRICVMTRHNTSTDRSWLLPASAVIHERWMQAG
jgi:hypothetical protein